METVVIWVVWAFIGWFLIALLLRRVQQWCLKNPHFGTVEGLFERFWNRGDAAMLVERKRCLGLVMEAAVLSGKFFEEPPDGVFHQIVEKISSGVVPPMEVYLSGAEPKD